MNNDQSIRGLITRSAETKTFPRHWIASRLAVVEANDGWLEATVDLLKQAHGPNFSTDDHLGKRALADRTGWDKGPPDSCSDTCHVRYLMAEFSDRNRDNPEVAFTHKEIGDFLLHGAKATLTSLAVQKHLANKAIREQGGWKGKSEEQMPDVYRRESMLQALELQEYVFMYLRSGGTLDYARTVPKAVMDVPGTVR